MRGRSVIPVCLPFRDHSVSPWRAMKQRGAIVDVSSSSSSSRLGDIERSKEKREQWWNEI